MKYMSLVVVKIIFLLEQFGCSKPASRKKDAKQVELNVATGGAGPLPILFNAFNNRLIL
jgi:hypothetical protein